MLRRVLSLCVSSVVLFAVLGSAFYGRWHLSMTLGALEGAGFSEGQCWLLAYHNLEVDLTNDDVPDHVIHNLIRWPGYGRVTDGAFINFCENILPFHCPGNRPAEGLAEVIGEWSLASMHSAMHYTPGEGCEEWIARVGWMLHAMQDFYAHSNWIEVFHWHLGFPFGSIPSFTSFMKLQRGENLNLILLDHARGNVNEARRLYQVLDAHLVVKNHALWNKDSSDLGDGCYDDGSRDHHRDAAGHTVVDFHAEAVRVASAETYQLGLQIRANIVSNPDLGPAVWAQLFGCVPWMEGSFEPSFKSAIDRLATYSRVWGVWE